MQLLHELLPNATLRGSEHGVVAALGKGTAAIAKHPGKAKASN
jgi:hypothetical protein